MAKLQSSPFQHQAHLRCSQQEGNLADDVTLNPSVIILIQLNCRPIYRFKFLRRALELLAWLARSYYL
jgi:hypothetical protein